MPVVRSRFYEQKFPEVCALINIVSLSSLPLASLRSRFDTCNSHRALLLATDWAP